MVLFFYLFIFNIYPHFMFQISFGAEPRSEPLEDSNDEDDDDLDMLSFVPDMRDGTEEFADHPIALHPSNRDFR